VVVLAVVGVGCRSVGRYFEDRARDFGDCFIAEFGYGLGLDVHVMLTDAISTGVGMGYARVVGVRHGVFYNAYNFHAGIPAWPFLLLFDSESRKEPWITDQAQTGISDDPIVVPPGYAARSVLFANISLYERKPWRAGYRNEMMAAFDVEVGAVLGFVAFRAGFSLGQFVDFLLGWFGLDIAGDDKR